MSGIVTSSEAGHPRLPGIKVCAQSQDNYHRVHCGSTGNDGRYSISVPPASYTFTAIDPYLYGDWVTQSYNGGKVYKVSSAKTVSFHMVRGARISGYLQTPGGNAPGTNVLSVSAYLVSSQGKPARFSESFSNTSESGYFKISKLPPGRYALQVTDGNSLFARQWFPKAATAKASTLLTVTTAQQLTDKNMTLTPGGTLHLTIKNPRGKAVYGYADLYDASGEYVEGSDTSSTGIVTVTGLFPGKYRASGSTHTVSYTQWYSKKKSLATANPITVDTGATISRSFTIHYPTLKAKKRPTVRIDANSVIAKPPRWNKKVRYNDIIWYRDGKRLSPPEADQHITKKADVGHRLKACFIGNRKGYASGRTCSRYTKKITRY